MFSQLIDVSIFHRFRRTTGERMVWLRATDSTLVSELVDSFVVLYFAFAFGPQKWSIDLFLAIGTVNNAYKVIAAFALIPAIYALRWAVSWHLEEAEASGQKQAAAAGKIFSRMSIPAAYAHLPYRQGASPCRHDRRFDMQYMLMFHEPDSEIAKRNDPKHANDYWGAWNAYVSAMNEAGIVQSGNGLQPPHTSTRVQVRAGKRHIQDGPFADVKEHLGGYFIIDVASLDEALEWAVRSPNVGVGTTEVRPVLPPPGA